MLLLRYDSSDQPTVLISRRLAADLNVNNHRVRLAAQMCGHSQYDTCLNGNMHSWADAQQPHCA